MNSILEIREWVDVRRRHIGTHWNECWKAHPECMATILLDAIADKERIVEELRRKLAKHYPGATKPDQTN